MHVLAGTSLALGAAALFGLGIVLQADVARDAPAEDVMRVRLLARLMRSPRWLAGSGVVLVGWTLQVAALWLAPVTLVQPALAFTVVVVLVLAAPLLGRPVSGAEALAACAIAAGIGAVAVVAPLRSGGHAALAPLLVAVAALAAVALTPLVARTWIHADRILPVAAGSAFALSSIATKLVTDSIGRSVAAGAAWLVVTALAAAVGGVDEMSAFRTRPAVTVIPVVLATETLLPVAAAPVLFGETWEASTARRLLLVLSLAAVTSGAITLGRSAAIVTSMRPD